jgi:hypothetical protein
MKFLTLKQLKLREDFNKKVDLIPNPIFKYSIGYSNSNFIFLVKKSSKSLSCMDIQLHFLKIFISKIVSLPWSTTGKNRVVALEHDW